MNYSEFLDAVCRCAMLGYSRYTPLVDGPVLVSVPPLVSYLNGACVVTFGCAPLVFFGDSYPFNAVELTPRERVEMLLRRWDVSAGMVPMRELSAAPIGLVDWQLPRTHVSPVSRRGTSGICRFCWGRV